jgi:hypothetical protein
MEYRQLVRLAVLVCGGFAMAIPCSAQDTGSNSRDQIELTRAEIQNRRQEIIQQLMELTPEQSEAFWPVYRQYRSDAAKLGDERVALIENYVKNSQTMTDKQAQDLLDSWFKLRGKQLDLQKKYVGRFRKVLPAVKVARLYQLENAMDAVLSANLQANLPMVGDTTQ